MLAVVTMSYEAEANSDSGPVTKNQKLSMVRSNSTFSFEDLTKLNIKEMTHYRKKTASERELIAKKLKNSSLGKRKPRRAIRRKQAPSKGAELTVAEADTDATGSPNIKSATESICGDSVGGGASIIGGGGRGGSGDDSVVSPLVRGSVSFDQTSKPAPSTSPRPSSSKKNNNRRKDTLAELSVGCGDKGGKSPISSTSSCKMKRQRIKSSAGGGTSVINVTKSMSSGGKRVSGRVKAVSDKDRNRFILETEDESSSRLGDTIFNIMGRKGSKGSKGSRGSNEDIGKEMRKLQSLQNEAPETHGILGVLSATVPIHGGDALHHATATTRLTGGSASGGNACLMHFIITTLKE